MATRKEIEDAYRALRDACGNKPPSEEELQTFVALLPDDKKERKNILNQIVSSTERRMSHSKFVVELEKYATATAKQDESAVQKKENKQSQQKKDEPEVKAPDVQPEKKNDEPVLDDKGKKIILESLASVLTQMIEDAEKKNKPDSIADLQWNLPKDRADDKDAVRKAKEKRRQKQAQGMRKAYEIPKEISDVQIIETCREAVKEYTLKKLFEQQKSLLSDDNFAEIEKQVLQAQKDAKNKEKCAQSNDFVKEVRKKFKKEFGYDLMGRNGSVLRTMREAVAAFKKENHIEKNNESERKPRPEKKDHKKKGGPDMADEKKITDEMKEKLKKLGLSDEEIGALSYDAAAEKLKTNEGGDDKPKDGDDKPKDGDDKDKDKDKDKDGPEEESTPKDPKDSLEVTETPGEEREHTDEKAPWVIRKQKWFDENIKPANEADYKVTRADNEFEVQFAQGSIHYESETNAVVSKDASYKVYEALLKDPDNAQRPVKFPENASEHLTNMLYAASILNETPDGKPHEMQGLDKSKLNMEAIEKALKEAGYGDAEFKKVKDYYEAHEGKPAAEDERGHDDHGVELSDVVKGVKAESFKRTEDANRMEFTPEPTDKGYFGTYNLETGQVQIMQPDGPDKMRVIYDSEESSNSNPALKPTKLTEDEVKHIKEQAKSAIEKEVRNILDERDKIEKTNDEAIEKFSDERDKTQETNANDFNLLESISSTNNDFINHVMGEAPDVILKIRGDENTPQSQKGFLQGKADSAKNIKDLLKERAALIDIDERDLTPKDRVALTKNYIALLAEYKREPSLVEVAMAEDLKQQKKQKDRDNHAKVHEDIKSEDKRSDFEEYHKTLARYIIEARDAEAAGEKLTIQDYMKKKYSTLSPEELDKRTQNQIQYNDAFRQYRNQKNTNTH